MRSRFLALLLLATGLLAGCGSTIPPYQPAVPQPVIKVTGNQLLATSTGNLLTFAGVTYPGLLTCADTTQGVNPFQQMASWRISAIRIPVSADLWTGTSCPTYHTRVSAVLTQAEALGLPIILTAQNGVKGQEDMATQSVATLWQQLALTLPTDPTVNVEWMLEPFDGPKTTSASIWLNGGSIKSATGTYTAIGMQALVDQLNKSLPGIPVIVDGFRGGMDLTPFLSGANAITGKNLIVGTQLTNGTATPLATWSATVAKLTPTYPVVATAIDDPSGCQGTWINQAISAARATLNGYIVAGWTVAGANCQPGVLLSSWTGTPSAYGQAVLDDFTAPSIRISGNQLLDINGRPMHLYGVGHPGFEYGCYINTDEFSNKVFAAMHTWNINAVRITVSSKYWLSTDAGCTSYRTDLASAIKTAEAQHFYVIIDLQSGVNPDYITPAPDAVTFWTQFLQVYKNDPNILAELYGEPHDISFAVWRNGGPVTTSTGLSYQAVGMQQLVTLANSIAPNTPLLVNGVVWGFDLSGVAAGYAINGKNIIYGTHPYDYSNKTIDTYASSFEFLNKTYPLLVEEFGDTQTCNGSWLQQSMPNLAANTDGMLAWAWITTGSVCGFPLLIKAYDGTPSSYGKPIFDFFQQVTKQYNVPLTTGAAA